MEIIDSHTHWGPSVSLGMTVTTEELLGQAKRNGVDRIVIFPFPSQALWDEGINDQVLRESRRVQKLIPYYYIPDDLRAIPRERGFYGGKWHWTRGVQDSSSNYEVLKDPHFPEFLEESEEIDLPIIVEEEFAFTKAFVERTKTLKVIIPHLGMLGGNPLEFLETFKDQGNVYFDTALANPSTIVQFIRQIGAERLLFGSDIPFGTMRNELDKINSLPIGDREKELILSRNIKRIIGMESD
jgi:hypothetical protein